MPPNIAFRREEVKPLIRVSRQYAFACWNRTRQAIIMATMAEKRRAALRRFFDSFGKRSRNRVCKRAKVAESAVRGFIDGRSQYLAESTYERLSGYSGWSVAALKGEDPPPAQQTSPSGVAPSNDLERNLSHGSGKTASRRPESEGDQVYKIRLELVDSILNLPAEYLPSIQKHIQTINLAAGEPIPHPQKRGKTGL